MSAGIHVPSLIERKRDGGVLSAEEIAFLVGGLVNDSIPEYQWSAMAMAIFFRGMSAEETWELTRSMRDSGIVLRYPQGHPPIVDKHSTGGVGDKVSLVLAPLLACDNVWAPMISGRGLGITGGTLDKLESIPGFQTRIDPEGLMEQLQDIRLFMAGQTADLCPADRKLYSLRDVTGTVPSRPLIVSSIMSKKLAESLDKLVLDVKYGSGAFMKSKADAEMLAASMQEVGWLAGVEISTLLTPMEEPLGRTVGNALEVRESAEALQGRGPEDLVKLTLDLAEKVSTASRAQLLAWLNDGTAWKRFQMMVSRQGGAVDGLEDVGRSIHAAPVIREVPSPASGVVTKFDAHTVGRACVLLGGGRAKADDVVDFSVGFDEIRKVGERVRSGEPLCRVHAASDAAAEEAAGQILSACEIA